jgi:predicted secreted protein
MGITSAIVLFAVVWFMVFFVVLPLRMVSQGEDGEIVPGTHASAPANAQIGRKAKITTFWAFGIWVILAGIIWSGAITVRDIDWYDRMSPISEPTDETNG